MRILCIHGANFNALERREKFYGGFSYKELTQKISAYAQKKGVEITFACSNLEGELIEYVQNADCSIIINAGAFSHTSLAVADALKALQTPKIEVHLTNISARNRVSITAGSCDGLISGLGIGGYYLAIDYLTGKGEQK